MWTITSTFLLTCCLRAAFAQSQSRSVWEDVIQFLTKGTKDECYMSVTGQGDVTKLRITCQGLERSYWCEYQGKPQVCRSYNKNPVHYFRQIMWNLRKLSNACQGQSVFKPLMCKRASDEAQMVFTAASSADAVPKARPEQMRHSRPKPTRPQAVRAQSHRAAQDKPNRPKAVKSSTQREITTPKPAETQATTQVPLSEAKRVAQENCWRSFHGVCTFFIGMFRS